MWRHTKESSKAEYTIPKEIEETIMLEFTPIEQELYFQAKGTSKSQGYDHATKFPTNWVGDVLPFHLALS